MSNNPYGMPEPAMGGGFAAAQKKVVGPAIALIVVGVINVIYSLYSALTSVLFLAGMNPMAAAQQAQFEQMQQSGQSAETVEMFQQISAMMAGPVGLVLSIIMFFCGVLILLGAIKMKNLKSRGLAMTSAILAMVPCFSPCCLLGLPFGIWALVAMSDPNVRSQFK